MATIDVEVHDGIVVSDVTKAEIEVIVNPIVDEIQKDPQYKSIPREKIFASVRLMILYLVECGLELSIPLSTPTIRLFKNLYETWFIE